MDVQNSDPASLPCLCDGTVDDPVDVDCPRHPAKKLFRHRIQIPAFVLFDIVTDRPAADEFSVRAVANYHFNLDEGNGLDHAVLDGRFARVFLETDDNGIGIKEFSVEDTAPEDGEENPDVYACPLCGETIPEEFKQAHDQNECEPTIAALRNQTFYGKAFDKEKSEYRDGNQAR